MSKLELKNVSKVFEKIEEDEKTHALKNIDLSIDNNEFVSIVGPSGCGKSTMLRLISGLIRPSQGKILLDGKEIEKPSSKKGMVFQKPTLFPWLTVGENVGFSGSLKNEEKIDQKEIDLMLEKVGLSEFKNSFPKQLSGGMAQRVSLIRTMIARPEVFLLDEPLGSLDAFTRMNMQDEILNLWQEIKNLMIMVTHDVEEAVYMSSKVIIMEPRPGRVKEIVDIDLPYPRDRTSDKFINYRNKILKILNY
ncbi:ABC transporter ATP-binding protein [Anaerococcus hydrogenalis]|uniref:ABC transporter ATP-binding protein n=1 Tax=Anaerococcus hydrogenalis TaxID=33029 RepID=A0A2N6UJS5_9FIRM|nr:ABC transporter ATP-binding protein [Anaerococcus hydrogenalis]MBS5989162.1 ABC transporter ATP-binding protein [Anaerococcus hydrogenalis]MDK7695027.1 ABC transporter ATP-binding protein [Anaerococcus hydrogenalis]MDK7696998.1 ABC transporter ATP-binding protein [Anaerococcus hydrogenalis]MDK7708054.1 ABC transporter ATP-binding protein [Anaerococcus hydrogenalis]PMC81987.1 ABC transporter ATP-binding protein [Anaerococcus hydrogenalis]